MNKDDRVTRYFKFVPFPKPGSTEGYSLIGHKLLTVIEEDTAVRNMRADTAALAISAPIMTTPGARWDDYVAAYAEARKRIKRPRRTR